MNSVNVFLTVDTEVWEFYNTIEENIKSSLWGTIDGNNYGLELILELFKQHQLKANFFVEPLFALRGYKPDLKAVVDMVQEYKQDVQLHIHTERLEESCAILPLPKKANLHQYSLAEQEQIIAVGNSLLLECGAKEMNAFRAGNYGGNVDTLKALEKHNFKFDTTYNHCYLKSACEMSELGNEINSRIKYQNIDVLPVTYFKEFSGKYRHLQIVACSFNELKDALNDAYQNSIQDVVIVLHSFEAVQRKKGQTHYHQLDKIVLQRLKNLCIYLNQNRDKFTTQLFSEQDTVKEAGSGITPEIKAKPLSTIRRYFEQLIRKVI